MTVFFYFMLVWIFLSAISFIPIFLNKKIKQFFKKEVNEIASSTNNAFKRLLMFITLFFMMPITLKESLRIIYVSVFPKKNNSKLNK